MTEPYRLLITPTARRQLAEQLPAAIAFAAYEFINGPLLANPHRVGKRRRARIGRAGTRANPHRVGKRLMPPLQDRYSARRGSYRVLYRIDDEGRTVSVVAVGPRSDIYRTR